MKKNNLWLLLAKWIVGILIILLAVAYGAYQTSINTTMSSASEMSKQTSFLQFLGNIIGLRIQGYSSAKNSKGNNGSDQYNPIAGLMDWIGSMFHHHPNTATAESESLEDGSQQMGNAQNNGENNLKNGLENGSGSNAENDSEDNSETNAENGLVVNSVSDLTSSLSDNSDTNADDNSEDSSQYNADDNSTYNPDDNSAFNSDNNPNDNSETNGENNQGLNAETTPTDNSGCSSGCYSGCSPGCDSGCVAGCSSISSSQANLPTINPIPTDSQVSQNIAQQNQQAQALATELTSREALAQTVLQQAQASKYQTVSYTSIPIPSSNPAPADIPAKVQSKQYSFH